MAKVPWYFSASHRRRISQWLAFAVVALLMSAFMLLPMRDIWTVEFSLANGAASEVEVTPIGKLDVSGIYGALPKPPESRFRGQCPRDAPESIRLPPGESATVCFDGDAISFTHLLVEAPDGRVLLQPVEYAPQGRLKDKYTVKSLSELTEAPDRLLPVLKGEKVAWTPEPTTAPPHSD